MSQLRVLLLPVLTACMFTQPFCCHCFAQMRTMAKCAEAEKRDVSEVDNDLIPVENGGICTKKPCLTGHETGFTLFLKTVYVWHGFPPAEATFLFCPSLDTHLLSVGGAHCPAWLRLSVLLI